MATNLALDQELLDRAFRVSGEPTKKAAVTLALQEFIARREQRRVAELFQAPLGTDQVFTTGLVLQELLQGFAGPKDRAQLVDRLSALAFLQPDKEDHIEAAEVRNSFRRCGVQVGTIDDLGVQGDGLAPS
jgi:predicted nucleic acid-binding protein